MLDPQITIEDLDFSHWAQSYCLEVSDFGSGPMIGFLRSYLAFELCPGELTFSIWYRSSISMKTNLDSQRSGYLSRIVRCSQQHPHY